MYSKQLFRIESGSCSLAINNMFQLKYYISGNFVINIDDELVAPVETTSEPVQFLIWKGSSRAFNSHHRVHYNHLFQILIYFYTAQFY